MRNKTFLLSQCLCLVFLLSLLNVCYADDTCPNGMRKTYIDEMTGEPYGSARRIPMSIAFYEGNGAIWYNKKAILEPRFEIHLKVNVEPVTVIENSSEQTLEGFTMVVSKTKKEVGSGTGEYLGYYGFTGSYIMEFDFNKNSNDPDKNSYSFRYCDTDCSNDDTKGITYGSLKYQTYDPTKSMNWDFRMIYIDKKLSVYSGANNLLYSSDVNFESKFGSSTGYVGFTGYMKGNRRELNMLGTFICQDNFDISKMTGKFYVGNQALDKAQYKPGAKIKYLFSFINNKGQTIPHCYKDNIWTYDFHLSVDCGASSATLTVYDSYSIYLEFTACKELGQHEIGLYETSKGAGPKNYYTIVADGLSKIELVGHDGKVTTFTTAKDNSNGATILKYGTASDGNFVLTGNSIVITLDFKMTDQYGNLVNMGTESSTLISLSQMSLVNSNSAKLTMAKKGDYYQVIITITSPGTYRLNKNQYMSESYEVIIYTGGPSASFSSCTLDSYSSSPTVKIGDTLTYSCHLSDGTGNAMTTNSFYNTMGYELTCVVQKTAPSTATYTVTPVDKSSYYSCSYTVKENGVFRMVAYFSKKSSTSKTEINGKINTFTVPTTISSINGAKILNRKTNSWIDLTSSASITYSYDYNGCITYIDFSDGTTLLSAYGTYPSTFSASSVTAKVTSEHDSSFAFKELTCKVTNYNGKQYVGIFTKDGSNTDTVISSSSYAYKLTITYGGSTKTVTINYQLGNIGSYKTCFHELDLSKTEITMFNNANKVITVNVKETIKIATVVLHTKDGLLYNHDIGTGNIKVIGVTSNQANVYAQSNSIIGTYTIYLYANQKFETNEISFQINGKTITTTTSTGFKIEALATGGDQPDHIAIDDASKWTCSGNEWNYNCVLKDKNEGQLSFLFLLKDSSNNAVYNSNFTACNIEITNNQLNANEISKYYSVAYDSGKGGYKFTDLISNKFGKVTWTITCRSTWKRTSFIYEKMTGAVSEKTSKYSLTQSSYGVGGTSYVEVTLLDADGNNINLNEGKLAENQKYVKVYFTNSTGTYQYTYDSISNSKLKYKYTYSGEGSFSIKVTYNGKEIGCSSSTNTVTVSYDKIDLSKCQMKYYTNSYIYIANKATVTVENAMTIPYFDLVLKNQNYQQTTNWDKSTATSCQLTLDSQKWDLKVTKYSYYIRFKFDEDTGDAFTRLKAGKYTLKVTFGTQTLEYYLNLLGDADAEDASPSKNYDLSKTYFNTTTVTCAAGTQCYFNIELRASDDLRWNYLGDTTKFKITNSQSSSDFNYNVQKGSKKGQFIIMVQGTKAGTGDLTISYNGETITKKVSFEVKCSTLFKLVYVSGGKDGSVSEPTIITFIPYDKYNNLYTDLFDSKVTSSSTLNTLTVGKSLTSASLTAHNYVSENKYLNVQYISKEITTITVTSKYFSESYTYNIACGSITSTKTIAEMKTTSSLLVAGGDFTVEILPRDESSNSVNNLEKSIISKFKVYYVNIMTNEKVDITDKCKLAVGDQSRIDVDGSSSSSSSSKSDTEVSYNAIECTTQITTSGSIEFHVEYQTQKVECNSCFLSVKSSELDITKTKVVNSNTKEELSTKTTNKVDVATTPSFAVSFYDQYYNTITDSDELKDIKIDAKFEGADIKLCVKDGDEKKIVTLCDSTNGDDNVNKWTYLTNGDNYYIIITHNETNTFKYKVELTGGDSDGSSGPLDAKNTQVSESKMTIIAGKQYKVDIELRATDGKRKNYWYVDFDANIKVSFSQDQQFCSYTLSKGEKPGDYVVKFKCTKVASSNTMTFTVEKIEVTSKVVLTIIPGNTYYLEVVDTNKFNVVDKKYTFKENPTNDDTITFNFKLLDEYKNYITGKQFTETSTSVASDKFGSDKNKYSVTYDSSKNTYLFTDKIDTFVQKHVWTITCLESNLKYQFTYTKEVGKVDVSKSDFVINNSDLLVKETSTVTVTLRDSKGENIGQTQGKLDENKVLVTVEGASSTTKCDYKYDTVTNTLTIVYTYVYEKTGEYKVTVKYDGQEIKSTSNVITVSYEKIAVDKTQLQMELKNSEMEMTTTSTTILNNLVEFPSYKLTFINANGEVITEYDKNTEITCVMTHGDDKWDLTVTKKNEYVIFNYKDDLKSEFPLLPKGNYYLIVTINGTQLKYTISFLGENGSEDASSSSVYDLSKTSFSSVTIKGIAGETYTTNLEFKASDGLRWNREVNLNSFGFTNSYGLDNSKLTVTVSLGEKKGQAVISINQKVATTGKSDNILTITYGGEQLNKRISIIMKCNVIAKLEYVSGYQNSTVENPTTLVFIPKDKYGNLYTDLFDASVTKTETLSTLTTGKPSNSAKLTTNNYVSENNYLNVQYKSTVSTTVTVTSKYFTEKYVYNLAAGEIDTDKSTAEMKTVSTQTAGDTYTVEITPRDVFSNEVNLKETDIKDFTVYYEVTETKERVDVTDDCKLAKEEPAEGYNRIDCSNQITTAGTVTYHVEYNDVDISCKTCSFKVKEDELDFSKTQVTYTNTNTQFSDSTTNVVELEANPKFELTFYDQYMNVITSEEEVKKEQVSTEFGGSDIKLCVTDSGNKKEATLCEPKDGDDNVNKWSYLTNGDSYSITVKETTTDNKKDYKVEITGGYTDGSSGTLDESKTEITPSKLEMIAGKESKVNMELKTTDGQRKNYWYTNPSESIKVLFKKDSDTCTYNVEKGDKPGQFVIRLTCTKATNSNTASVKIEDVVAKQTVELVVIPSTPAYSKIYDSTGKEITTNKLGSVSVEDKYVIKQIVYDKYNNQITDSSVLTNSVLGNKLVPYVNKVGNYSVAQNVNSNGEAILTLTSTIAADHQLSGKLLNLSYYNITFTCGKASAENSLLEVSTQETNVGEVTNVYVIAYDQYNNYIDASQYETSSPFDLSFTSEGSTTKNTVSEYTIETVNDQNVISYVTIFTTKGINTISGYIEDDQIKCVSCTVNVKTNNVDFMNNDFKRLDSTSNSFVQVVDKVVEKNAKEDAVYRIYPRDEYGNAIDVMNKTTLESYDAYIVSQKDGTKYEFKLNNDEDNQAYAEFVTNDEGNTAKYEQLVGGYYTLTFTNGKEEKTYTITLAGTAGDSDASNKPADIQNTHVNSENLKFLAGESGEMFLEIRTEDNLRRNSWDGIKFTVLSCDSTDKTFKYTQEKAGTFGVFHITVTTEKANTYPELKPCKLTVKVNDEEVKNLDLYMEVSPNTLYRSEILDTYYKEKSSSKVLKDGTTDSNYVFEVKSFDKYDNLVETDQSIVGITVSLNTVETKSTSNTDTKTGYRKYIVTTTTAGQYTVSSNTADNENGSYLPNESTFNIGPGEIDPSKTIVEEVASQITAGEKPSVTIASFDKNGNRIDGEYCLDKYEVTFVDSKKSEHEAQETVTTTNSDTITQTSSTDVTTAGTVTVVVTYKETGETIAQDVEINVVPGEPDPKNTVISRENSLGSFTTYKNGDEITYDTNTFIKLNVTLYDTYNNYISKIPEGTTLEDATLSGNDMEEIKFTVTNNNDHFYLDFSGDESSVEEYKHLVSGDNYEISFDVKTTTTEGEVKLDTTLTTDRNDEGYGNGPYDIAHCVIKPAEQTFYAGDYAYYTLELRTEKGLLYNNDINYSSIGVKIGKEDASFSSDVAKAGTNYGIYTITITSTKKGENTMTVSLKEAKSEQISELTPVKYKVLPQTTPDQNHTEIVTRPNEEVSNEGTIEFTFKLADKYGNVFDDRQDIIDNSYLTVVNNEDTIVGTATKTLEDDGETYKVDLDPIYPPREMNLNVIYNDGNSSVICFNESIKVLISSQIAYGFTDVTSTNAVKINVGETLDMQLYVYDKQGICIDNDDYSSAFKITVTGPLDSTPSKKKEYSVRKVKDENLDCQNKYEIITTDEDKYTQAGEYTIKVTAGDEPIATYDQVCDPLCFSMLGFNLDYVDEDFDPNYVPITDTIRLLLTGHDEYGNKVTDALIDDITVGLTFKSDNGNVTFTLEKQELVSGNLYLDLNPEQVGLVHLHLYYKGEEITVVNTNEDLPDFNIVNGPCSGKKRVEFDTSLINDTEIGEPTSFTFQCYDVYGNKITKGGETFKSTGAIIVDQTQTTVDTTVVDNGDGTYTVKLTPPLPGDYIIGVFLQDEKYGDDVTFELSLVTCEDPTPIKCPNGKKCVAKYVDCMEPPSSEKCAGNTTHPFWCAVNGVEQCTKSQTDCDCEKGYIKCDYMKYCVPKDRPDMCLQVFNPNACVRQKTYKTMNDDGVCRSNKSLRPSQRVCPIGYTLCADLSCRPKIQDCIVSEVRPDNKFRCVEQTLETSAERCPTTVTCNNKSQVVCPDGTCVDNEIECRSLVKCDDTWPYLCSDNSCVTSYELCPKSVACGTGRSLCADMVCRTSC